MEIYRSLKLKIYAKFYKGIMTLIFKLNRVHFDKDFTVLGFPILEIDQSGNFSFGKKMILISNVKYSALGKNNRSKINVGPNAQLLIGNNVGLSNVTIISKQSITIGNNILLGGGVIIVDTDFHSLNPIHWHTDQDEFNMKTSPVVIGDNVFIGMNSIILKGVKIGNNSIVGAGSVVSKNIPPNEIWAGNPAQFIKKN